MRDARGALEAPHGFLAAGIVDARGIDYGGERGDGEAGEQRDVGRLGQVRPDVQERYEQKQPGNARMSHSRGHRRSK